MWSCQPFHPRYPIRPLECGPCSQNIRPNGMRKRTLFCGVKIAAILNLYSRFELRQVQEVTAIDWQILDLISSDNTLNRRLLRIHVHFGTFNGNDRVS